jgi:hypothetical protein
MMTPDGGLFIVAAEKSYSFDAADLINIVVVENNDNERCEIDNVSNPWLKLGNDKD